MLSGFTWPDVGQPLPSRALRTRLPNATIRDGADGKGRGASTGKAEVHLSADLPTRITPPTPARPTRWRWWATGLALLALLVWFFNRPISLGSPDEYMWKTTEQADAIARGYGSEQGTLPLPTPPIEFTFRGDTDDWVVVRAFVDPNERYPRDHEAVIWSLEPEVAAWFRRHPTMPKLPNRTEDLGRLGIPEHYAHVVYAHGVDPGRGARLLNVRIFGHDRPVVGEPRSEAAARANAYSFSGDGSIVSQYPRAGAPLRPGQLILAFVKPDPPRRTTPAPRSRDAGSGPWPSMPLPDNNDDSFDFPDRLCPTRFC